MPHRHRLAAAIALPMLLAACGHGSPKAGPSTDASLSPSASGSVSATASVPPSGPGASGSGRPSASGRPDTSGSASPQPSAGGSSSVGTTPPKDFMPVTMTLAHACVSPGGEQRVDMTAAPGALVVIDTTYSDGKDGQKYGGLNSNAQADSQGHLSYSWRVLPNAPTGDATTYVAAVKDGKHGSDKKTFQVKTIC